MFSSLQPDTLPETFGALLKSLHKGIVDVAFHPPGPNPQQKPDELTLPVRTTARRLLGTVVITLVKGADPHACEAMVKSALDKAVAAVARPLGVELAWLSDPRSQVNVAVRGNDHELDGDARQGHARAVSLAADSAFRRSRAVRATTSASPSPWSWHWRSLGKKSEPP